jgi:hypothetical protein
MIKSERDEKIEIDDRKFLLGCFSDNFNILDLEVNKTALEIIGGIKLLDKELGKELADALLKALTKVNYQALLGDNPEVPIRLDLVIVFAFMK